MDFERLSSVLELLKRSLAESYNEIKAPVALPYVSQSNLPADEVANLWKVCMDADKSRASAWPNPTVRIFVLVALFADSNDFDSRIMEACAGHWETLERSRAAL
jgi:hypothetical protein